MKRQDLHVTLVLSIVALLSGCAVGPDYEEPLFGLQGPSLIGEDTRFTEVAPDPFWWRQWDDPVLEKLIMQGVLYNKDLQIAWANLNESRALRGLQELDLLPSVTADGTYQNSKASENVFRNGFPTFDSSQDDFYSLGFDATWELDLYGRVRRQAEAARARFEKSTSSYENTLISLVSEIAREYAELRGFDDRLEIAKRNAGNQKKTLEVTQNLEESGLGNEFDRTRAEANLALTESSIPELKGEQLAALNRLAVLIGLMPGEITEWMKPRAGIISVPTEVAVGLSSEILRRRPDIKVAERELAAATAEVGVAEADFFPRFVFSGSLSLDSSDAGKIFTAGSGTWSFGPGMQWAFLDLGRVIQNKRAADARLDAAVAMYEKAVLTALEETLSAMARLEAESKRAAKLAEAVKANRRAVELSKIRYQQGLDSLLPVLDVERQLLQSEEELSLSQTRQSILLITLYKALGGLALPPPSVLTQLTS
ncbi:MAG: efflux transporter outer membrane subunit [Verrucomicrobiota bacterium]